jgi:hypothetical protein
MSFASLEAERLARLSETIWGYETDGSLLPAGRAKDNVFEGIRDATLAYFRDYGISWWHGREDHGPGPTRYVRSSQVACVNHLAPLRHDRELALAVVRNVLPTARAVVEIDGGYVAFEWIGQGSYLGERGTPTRGANVTSLDAYIVAEMPNGSRRGIVIEWKYTERYGAKSLLVSRAGTSRLETYRPLLERPDCPIVVEDLAALFFDPFLQLMRQTLLAWQICEQEGKVDTWVHVHVVPAGNVELLGRVTSPGLRGSTMSTAWASALREPARYACVTPSQLVAGTASVPSLRDWRRYLAIRYGT